MRDFTAELIGTFFLVFAGTAAVVVNHYTQGVVTHVGVALTWGLVVMMLAYTFGPTSGAHLNSAVTLGLLVAGRFERPRLFRYLFAQLLGAFAASMLLRVMYPQDETLGATLPLGELWRSFALEVIMTFMLLQTILSFAGDASPRQYFAPIAVGAVIGVEALFAGPISGASMNPTRSIAPAVVSGHLEHIWIYLTAPFIGAALAGALNRQRPDNRHTQNQI